MPIQYGSVLTASRCGRPYQTVYTTPSSVMIYTTHDSCESERART